MAVTDGHGNPDWTRDETILALELYQSCDGKLPGGNDPRVIALSNLLRQLPLHPQGAKKPSFRNPDGVAFKLLNLNAAATNRGLSTSYTDRAVWKEFGHQSDKVQALSQFIRSSAHVVAGSEYATADEQFAEGQVATVMHKQRERSSALRKSLLKSRLKKGPLSCDVCDARSPLIAKELQESIFEAHHITPLATIGESKTKLSDVALLCASCHRLIHRAIAVKRQWLGVAELRDLMLNTLKSEK